VRRLRPLSEVECYLRLYGDYDATVRVIRLGQPTRPARASRISGEQVRRLFEARLDAREPEAA